MSKKLLLVDFENVQQVDLGRLDDEFKAIIFVGASQKSVPIELVMSAQALGSRVEWQRIEASGNNALDFFIAFHLGRLFEGSTKPSCLILSKDKGYDPLIRHINKAGLKCRRINSLIELNPASPAQDLVQDGNYARVVELLGKSEKKARPRKRTTLASHISAQFQKKLDGAEINRLIDLLFAKKMVSEENGIVTYSF
jgi:hypothetical protein